MIDRGDFRSGEGPVLPWAQRRVEVNRAHAFAVQGSHLIANGMKHSLDLVIAAFVDV